MSVTSAADLVLALIIAYDVVEINGHKLISVWPVLGVDYTQRVHHFVGEEAN